MMITYLLLSYSYVNVQSQLPDKFFISIIICSERKTMNTDLYTFSKKKNDPLPTHLFIVGTRIS